MGHHSLPTSASNPRSKLNPQILATLEYGDSPQGYETCHFALSAYIDWCFYALAQLPATKYICAGTDFQLTLGEVELGSVEA